MEMRGKISLCFCFCLCVCVSHRGAVDGGEGEDDVSGGVDDGRPLELGQDARLHVLLEVRVGLEHRLRSETGGGAGGEGGGGGEEREVVTEIQTGREGGGGERGWRRRERVEEEGRERQTDRDSY